MDAKLSFQSIENLHRTPHMARGPGANLEPVAPLRFEAEGVVECGYAVDLAQWDVNRSLINMSTSRGK